MANFAESARAFGNYSMRRRTRQVFPQKGALFFLFHKSLAAFSVFFMDLSNFSGIAQTFPPPPPSNLQNIHKEEPLMKHPASLAALPALLLTLTACGASPPPAPEEPPRLPGAHAGNPLRR